jgi:IS1 family transposase
LLFHVPSLSVDFLQGFIKKTSLQKIDNNLSESAPGYRCRKSYVPSIDAVLLGYLCGFLGGFLLALYGLSLYDKRTCLGASFVGFGVLLSATSVGWFLIGLKWNADNYKTDQKPCFQHNAAIVPHKYLDIPQFSGHIITRGQAMANVLNMDKQIMVIGALAEGSSIRSIERMTGVHRDTIMRLGVKVGQGCTALMDSTMRDLSCTRLEFDEIWGFVGKKEKHVRINDDPQFGSVWTFCAIDAKTKLVPAFKVGDRSQATANAFVADVASRMKNRVQISTDGLAAYVGAIEDGFGADADYGQIIKVYGTETVVADNRRYSAPALTSIEKKIVAGNPNYDLISTSYVERLNATTRLHMRRLTRLTLAFSKKRENFEAAVGLHFAYYNFVKRHNTLRCTPAMEAGVAKTFWSVGDLLEAAA